MVNYDKRRLLLYERSRLMQDVILLISTITDLITEIAVMLTASSVIIELVKHKKQK